MSESQHIEWKRSWRDEYLKWICGFANADGGRLVIGKEDDGRFVGIDNAKKHPSKPFNPDIANAFFRAGLIESWGRGTLKIIKACKDHALPSPVFSYELGDFNLVVFGQNHLKNNPEKSQEKLSLLALEILALLKEDATLTRTKIAEMLVNTKESTVRYQIDKLKKLGYLERKGTTKKGYWVVLNKNNLKNNPEKNQEKAPKHKPENSKEIMKTLLEALTVNSKLSRKELALTIEGMTEYRIRHYIERLKKEGKIQRVGSTRAGHWIILEDIKDE